MAAQVKLHPACLKALEGKGELCSECEERVRKVLAAQAPRVGRPDFWVPAEGEGILLPGRSRMGKSTFAKEWTLWLMEEGEEEADEPITVYWWDPQREASCEGIERDNTPLGPLRAQVTASDVEHDGKWLKHRAGGRAPAIAMVPDEEYPGREERADDFVRAMRQVLKNKPKGRCVIFVEEAGLLEGHTAAETMLLEMVTTWGKEGVGVVIMTQSVSMVQEKTRRGCRWVVSFNQLDDNDLRAHNRLVGPKYARVVGKLQPYQCVLADRMDRARWRDSEESPEEAGAEEAA